MNNVQELRTRMWVFDRTPITQEAKKIVDQLFISLHLNKTNSKKLTQKQANTAKLMFSRILCSLICITRLNPHQIIYRSLSKDAFSLSYYGVSYPFFKKAMAALKAKGYITHELGGMYPLTDFPDEIGGEEQITGWYSTKASQFTVTPKFIKLCGNKYGLGKKKIERHFQKLEPASYIDVRYPSVRHGRFKYKGRRVPNSSYRLDPQYAFEEKDMKKINDYLNKQDIGGACFTGLKRTFNNYTDEGYNWDKGGRLCGIGSDHYQALPSKDRKHITINGAPTVEIDIMASHLTIAHRLMDKPLRNEPDLYDVVKGVHRSVVKAWMTITLANAKPCVRWPARVTKKLREKGLWKKGMTATKVGQAVLRVYPWLTDLSMEDHGWPVLQYIEAEVIKETLLNLIDRDIPALPIHDSIIVPQSHQQEAEDVLFGLFYAMLR